MARRSGLGKGLSALIPTEVTGDRTSALREVPIGNIKPNPRQPRVNFDEETMSSLAASIKELGVLQPVLVRRIGGEASDEFELIAGERRWRASRRAGLHTIPVLIQTSDDTHSLEQALVENLHRQDLNVLEEAAAYQQLIEEFGTRTTRWRPGWGRAGLRSPTSCGCSSCLRGAAPARRGQISPGHARALLGTPDRGYQEVLARQVVSDGMTVRAIEDLIRAHNDEVDGVVRERRARRRGSVGRGKRHRSCRPRSRRSRCRGSDQWDARAPSAPAAGNPRTGGTAVEPPQHPGEG